MLGDELRRPDGVILTPIKSIRKHCIECMSGVLSEVPKCTAPKCWLFPYRMGKNPRKGKQKGRSPEAMRAIRPTKPSISATLRP